MQYHFPVEELSGTYYDIGVQHGRANAARMRWLLEAFEIDLAAPWQEADLLRPLERLLPELGEEIHGIAAGSGMSLREVCALSFYIDLHTAVSACTGMVFVDGPDGPIVGKTSDCTPGVQQAWLRQRLVRPRGGLAALIHSHYGSPNAEMGMNERGLAIGISGLISRDIDPQGVGWQQDIRAVLHACTTTGEAIAMLQRLPIRRFGYCAVVGDAAGDVALVEKVVGAVGVRRPRGRVAYEANVACCPEVIPLADPSVSANGMARLALLDALCADESALDYSLQGMLHLFSAHAEPAGICQHGPELHSNVGFFMLPRTREVCIARGYTCARQLETIRIVGNAPDAGRKSSPPA